MTVRSIELVASRRGRGSTGRDTEVELIYTVSGATLMIDAVASVLTAAPATFVDPVNDITLVQNDLEWEPTGRMQDGSVQYEVRVSYVDPVRQDERKQIDTGDYKVNFDTTGGQAKFTTSKQTIATFVPAGVPAADYDFKQAINVGRDGEVQGIDVTIPAMKFSISYRQPLAVITNAYVAVIEALTGTVNNATFWGRAAGEVLFLGASGSQGIASDPQIDYHFIRSRNVSGQTIGDIVNVAKLGHEVLWCVFEDEPNATFMPRTPKAVKVERVYDLADLSALGIGTSA